MDVNQRDRMVQLCKQALDQYEKSTDVQDEVCRRALSFIALTLHSSSGTGASSTSSSGRLVLSSLSFSPSKVSFVKVQEGKTRGLWIARRPAQPPPHSISFLLSSSLPFPSLSSPSIKVEDRRAVFVSGRGLQAETKTRFVTVQEGKTRVARRPAPAFSFVLLRCPFPFLRQQRRQFRGCASELGRDPTAQEPSQGEEGRAAHDEYAQQRGHCSPEGRGRALQKQGWRSVGLSGDSTRPNSSRTKSRRRRTSCT
jgi:hypothetical protein